MAKEWHLPLVVAKLGIRGAFHRIPRRNVAQFVAFKLQFADHVGELRYLLSQLHPNVLSGVVTFQSSLV